MKETIIIISDYREGEPVVASVRFAGLMKYFKEKYKLLVITDRKHGSGPSRFADISCFFETMDSKFTQTMKEERQPNRGMRKHLEDLLRQKWILAAWRNYKYSKYAFVQKNGRLYTELDKFISQYEIKAVFATVPDVNGLYIVDCIKQKAPGIPAIIEIRDIINHNIGEGQPKFAFKRAEQLISKWADGIIAVSRGIFEHYRKQNGNLDIQLIRNGYDEELFAECSYQPIEPTCQSLTLLHAGSIYKGRNVKALIQGLLKFHERTGIQIQFNVLGLLDQQALEEIHSLEISGSGVSVEVMGSVCHEEAVSMLKAADIAVILTHMKGSDYAIPGKTFEYIGACKPIIAVTQDPELVSLVHGRYGECAKFDSEDITDSLRRIMNSVYDFSSRDQYSRKLQAERILELMELKINH